MQNHLFKADTLEDCFRRADSLFDPDNSCYSGLLVNNKDLRRLVLLVSEIRRIQEENKEMLEMIKDIPCTCGNIYQERGLCAPDCPRCNYIDDKYCD